MSLLRWNGFGGRDCRCSGKTIRMLFTSTFAR